MNQKFSVAMSVYKNDRTSDFTTAVLSIYNQTCPPDEIILVIDGPVSQCMMETIGTLQDRIGIMKVVSFPVNRGHAAARQAGLNNACNELVAIMDSDDIAEPTRFEKQLKLIEQHPEVSVVGSIIHEFIGSPDNVIGTRVVPETDEEIKKYLKSRCPMNLQTVMCRKSRVLKVGGFMNWFCEEDYFLWIRLALAGHKFYNYQESLVNVRVGKEMYQRRGGLRYFKSEAKLQCYMLKHKIIGLPRFIYNVAGRFIVQVAMPNSVRSFVFQKLFRD